MFEFNDCVVNFHYFVVPKRLVDDLDSLKDKYGELLNDPFDEDEEEEEVNNE